MQLGERDGLCRRGVGRDGDDLRPRRHHALDREAFKADHALQHELLLLVQRAGLAAGLHNQTQLVGAEVAVRRGTAIDAQRPRDQPAGLVERPDTRAEDGAEEAQRARDRDRDLLRILQRDALRGQLASDDVQGGDQGERDGDPKRVRADCPKDRVQQPGQRRLADPTKREAGDRDAELASRDVAIEVAHGVIDVAGARPALGDQLLHARSPHGHERELGRNEEAVQ